MTYRALPPAPGSRRERRLRSKARLRTYRQVGTTALVVAIAAGSFTSAGAADVAGEWFGKEHSAPELTPAVTAAPVLAQTSTVSESREVPFAVIEQPNFSALAGARTVIQAGAPGVELVTYTVTEMGGVEVSREASLSVTVTAPVDEIVSVGQLTIPPATDVEKGSNRDTGKQLAEQLYGWTGDQWACLDALWARESGWSHTSANRSTGAYGIPQALPGSKMAVFGADWATNPSTQIQWGLSYINGRYGSPCGAWGAFQNKGWY